MATQAIPAMWATQMAPETPEQRNTKMYAAQRARRQATPEVNFAKRLDNSRLQAIADPERNKEIRRFVAAMAVLFALVMVYGWQHYYAIQVGYKIEAQKQQRDELQEENRMLRLNEAQLSAPSRLGTYARALGMDAPTPAQFVRQQGGAATGAPVEARVVTPKLPVQQ